MMSFGEFAESIGACPAHPQLWTAPQREAYQAWMLANFRARWHRLVVMGYPELVRAQSGREALLRQVREELALARLPAPSQPWAHCACHRQRFCLGDQTPELEQAIDDEDVALWRSRDREARMCLPQGVARALAYIETFAPKNGKVIHS